MALKDLKSELSKFRMPKAEPLESKPRVNVERTQNQTPLSGMVESAPKIPRSTTTTNKEGVNPTPIKQGDKFKGETTPTPMSLEQRYLGQTDPTKMDNSEKFLGETNPTKMDNSEKFLGQTDPTKMDNSEKFLGETNPTESDKSSKFLGETNPTKMDNSEKFLGETNPTKMDNSEKFLGETSPNPMDTSEKFLGQTEPTKMNTSEKFLGETTPTPMSLEERFLGQTEPTKMNASEKFKGETTPNKFNNDSNFIIERNDRLSSPFSTEPNPMDLSGKFLGETNTTPITQGDKPKGQTDTTLITQGDKPKGETSPTSVNNTGQFLGETSPTSVNNTGQFLGETSPNNFVSNPNHSDNGVTPSDVNYFTDIHATGFNSKFGGVDATKFVGINPNNTVFDTTNSKYSDFSTSFNGLNSAPGYGKFKLSKSETGNVQRYNPNKQYYTTSGVSTKSISELQEQRNSPSFLDEMYSKFNLRDDAFNLGTAAFSHPLILRGIQRKGITKGEPQKWGFGFPVDDGLVRGGIVTAVDRSVVDAVRLGKWMISVQGLLWGIKNLGLQASNSNVETLTGKRLTKVWTPINTIASAIGGFVGLRPRRHGILPLPEAVGPEKYETVQKAKKLTHRDDISLGITVTGNRLVGLYNESFITIGGTSKSLLGVGLPFLRLQSPGGPNSLYGLIPGGRFPHRDENTRRDTFTGFTSQKQYNPIGNDPSSGPSANGFTSLPFDRDNTELGKKIKPYTEFNEYPNRELNSDPNDTTNKKVGIIHNDEFTYGENRSSDVQGSDYEGNDLGLIWEAYTTEGRPSDGALNRGATHKSKESPFAKEKNTEGNIHPIEKNDTAAEFIKSYETIAYGTIPTRVAGTTDNTHDFRSYLSDTNTNKKIADTDDYSRFNINQRVHWANPGKVSPTENRYDWFNTEAGTGGNTDRYDKINAQPKDGAILNDLVHLLFKPLGGGSTLQFRGTISGLTDTFSPSWDSVKYAGRADQGYKMSTFERSVSFNFQAYATSRIEMKPMWDKLQYLSSLTMPEYSGDGYQGTLIRFNLGSLYSNKLAFIESLTYTMSDELPWEISMTGAENYIGELPMGVDVAIGLKVLEENRPAKGNSTIYSWNF